MRLRFPKRMYFNPYFRLCDTKSSEPHIFVVGAPRSGTTLLAGVISAHSNICSYNSESGIFQWKSNFLLFEGMLGRNSQKIHQLRREQSDVVQLFDVLANECRDNSNAGRFLEKTPQHILYLDYILDHFPESQVLHIFRDPRDCYHSSKSNRFVTQNTPKKYLQYWKKCILARHKFAAATQIIDIRYEELVSKPDKIVRETMDWLGETYEPNQIAPEILSRLPTANSREFGLLGKAISTDSVGKWKSNLSNAERSAIDQAVHGVPEKYLPNS